MKRVGILHRGVEIRQEELSNGDQGVPVKHDVHSIQVSDQQSMIQPPGSRFRIVEL
jgi:hypothetical protein